MVNEAISTVVGVSGALGKIYPLLKAAAESLTAPSHTPRNATAPSAQRIKADIDLRKARRILNAGRDTEKLKDLAIITSGVEAFGDMATYLHHNKKTLQGVDEDFIPINLKILDDHLRDMLQQSSSRELHDEQISAMPDEEVRRCQLYISSFPEFFIFNSKRIHRLLAADRYLTDARGNPIRLEQLPTGTFRVVEGSWNANEAPLHFRIGSDVRNRAETWPESVRFMGFNDELIARRVMVSDASDKTEGIVEEISYEIYICSLIQLSKNEHTLNLEIIASRFPLLRSLSLRNVKLESAEHLKYLCLLRYLDLKYSYVQNYVKNCNWLEGLEELEVLDLRHTNVKEISDKCLEKLRKLQCLLLGYRRDDSTRLRGATIIAEKLNTKGLNTLRAIKGFNSSTRFPSNVADLLVTDLTTNEMEDLWGKVENLEHLTSLGLAAARGYAVVLPPQNRQKDRLQRLRLEGEIKFGSSSSSAQPNSPFDNLRAFTKLVDLTICSPIKMANVPDFPELLCLRLYGLLDGPTLKFDRPRRGFRKLKKLVIGDMQRVGKIEIHRDILKGLATLKLCDLPKFQELLSLGSQTPMIVRKSKKQSSITREHSRQGDLHGIGSAKIFLKGAFDVDVDVDASCNMNIYTYDM